ncbi:FtsX-like permease family protein [Aureliella helgolandensis]|uniref:FtsX-like permease family protein n=1 Tax=Aureliella helgolandensis TaxID=2527968 RepID=A0A518GGC3_9BACT|nr:FtsX-like permease family protein [Aureliella helgolandensis]QDV27652.1 FtsX-like permease family protein [Aureliella helgolandensis]
MRTPLAWHNLTSSFAKCALAATGVGFAVVLMFMQIGFRNALIDNNVQIFSLFDTRVANLTMLSRARYNISTEQRFERNLLEQAAALPGVQQVCVVSVERGTAQVQVAGHTPRPIRVIGVELHAPHFFADPNLFQDLQTADAQQAALVDTRSKPGFGFAGAPTGLKKQAIELNGKSLPVTGQFQLGTDFGNDGTLLLSERLHADYFPWRNASGHPSDVVDIGLIQASSQNTEELDLLAARIAALAPRQIDVARTDTFIVREKNFWASNTPIGKIFLIGTIMGLVVGAIICYQIQFTDISDHMPELATLKAMGYGPAYFWSLVLCQSFYLACLGFIPGLVVSLGLYHLLATSSGLVMAMTWDRILLVWILTMVMCVASGILAIRKLFHTDPASLF